MNGIRWIITLLLIAVVGYGITVIVLCYIEGQLTTPPRMAVTAQRTPQLTETRSVDYHLMKVRALFPPPAEAMTRAESSGKAPILSDVALQLSSKKLVATIIGNQGSLAVINDGDVERTVTQGQSIWGYKVKRISADKVLLTDGICDVQLKIGGRKPEVFKTAIRQAPHDNQGSLVPSLIRTEMSRQEFKSRIESPDRNFGPLPYIQNYRNGKPFGFKIVYVTQESLLAALGFCNGDIMLSYNGKKLYTP